VSLLVCAHCGSGIEGRRADARYCSDTCRRAAFDSLPVKTGRACENCGANLPSFTRCDARYCSTSCRSKGYREVRQAELSVPSRSCAVRGTV